MAGGARHLASFFEPGPAAQDLVSGFMTNIPLAARPISILRCLMAVATFVLASGVALADSSAPAFVDPLDAPAVADQAAFRKPMMAVAHAGNRLVAVGMRGAIVLSDDGGKAWRQSMTPVQSDLTAVTFATAQRGWAVGHDGVILSTTDGGGTWTRQFDGRMAAQRFPAHYRALQAAGHGGLDKLLKEVERNYQAGPVLPFLDVVFDDARQGYAVGPFGMVAWTQDGGKTWLPGLERVQNPDLLSLYAARKIDGQLYLAGERGMVYRLDRARGVFVRLPTGYNGSLFGIVGNEHVLVAYGLRGTVAVSRNGGVSWTVSALPVPAAVVGADILKDGRVALIGITGHVWLGNARGSDFAPLPMEYAAPATSVLSVTPDSLIVGGLRGVVVQAVPMAVRP